MHIILIPGLWLDASSWDDVSPALREAGHEPHSVTLPGVGEPADRSGEIGITEWVGAVVDLIDRLDGDVVLVGHSGGGNVAWGAADRRVDRVGRVILVDTLPPTPGGTRSKSARSATSPRRCESRWHSGPCRCRHKCRPTRSRCELARMLIAAIRED